MSNKYILEICPITEAAKQYYSSQDKEDDNAGFDLYSSDNIKIYEQVEFIPFGIKVRMLKVVEGCELIGCHYWLVPRSSIYKSGLIMANSVGVIDSSYRGELKAPVWSMTGTSKVEKGDRLFQILAPDMGHIHEIRIVDSLPDTVRGEGGFGSSGLK
jgi:dUTP pyrophosphatase